MWLVLVLCLCLLPCSAPAATYYLHPGSGSDSAAGDHDHPWKTLTKLRNGLAPGDVVNIRGGGPWGFANFSADDGYIDWGDCHTSRGTANNPITIQAMPGETPIFDGEGFARIFGFFSASDVPFYLIIKGLTMQNVQGGTGIVFGSADDQSSPCDGSMIPRWASYLALLNNTFQYARQSGPGGGRAHHIIIKGNTSLDSTFSHTHYVAEQLERSVFEDNWDERGMYYGFHMYGHLGEYPARDHHIYDWIIRRNTFVNICVGSIPAGSEDIKRIKFFHNTYYNDNTFPFTCNTDVPNRTYTSGIIFHNTTTYTGPIIVKNNITHGYYQYGSFVGDNSITTSGQLQMDYNLLTNLFDANRVYAWGTGTYSQATFRAATGSAYDSHGLSTNPLFTNITARNFTLQTSPTPSPAIDAGDHLTTATNSSSTNPQSLQVADAGYFHDGFGLIQGDTIQIGPVGGQAPVVVTSINYATNTLSLQSARTWSAGATVNLPFSGTKPDMGAYETSGPLVGPRTVYVAQTGGNDSNSCDGGISSPRQTTAGGVACLTPGSTLYYRTGTYGRIDSDSMAIPGGTDWANPTTFAAYSGEAVTLTTSLVSTAVVHLGDSATNQYIVFDGLVLDALNTPDTDALWLANVNYIRFQNGTLKNAPVYCAELFNNVGIEILASRLTNCGDGINAGTNSGSLYVNNLLYGNATDGLAIRGSSTNPKVYANTVSGNGVRGIHLLTGVTGASVRSNVAYGNTATPASQIVDDTGGAGGNVVSGNITTNPLWANAATGDFHLTTGSPAINTGVPLTEVATDFDRNVRCTVAPCTANPPEAGALEFLGAPVPPSVSSRFPAPPYTTHFLAR